MHDDYIPIRETDCDTAEEFLDALSIHADPFCRDRHADWYFRGQPDDALLLIPTALRIENLQDIKKLAGRDTYADHFVECGAFQVWLEAFLLKSFLACADDCGLPIPDMSAATFDRLNGYVSLMDEAVKCAMGDDMEGVRTIATRMNKGCKSSKHANWPDPYIQRHIALARHCGLPTRLLDWSQSPRIAAYFAASKAAELVWDPPSQSKLISVWAFSQYARGPWKEGDATRYGVETIRVPNDQNRNMFAQWGGLTTSIVTPDQLSEPIDRRPADEIAKGRIKWREAELQFLEIPAICRVRVPLVESREILWRLSREGISMHRLFPEFSRIVEAMREEWNHWWPHCFTGFGRFHSPSPTAKSGPSPPTLR